MATEDERYNLDQRIDHVTNESLSATRRIRQVAEETNQMGVETLITVNEQGEQLDNVERRLDEINVDMKRTDKHLTELEKCCGCFTCCCRPPDYTKRRDYKQVYGRSRQDEELITEQPTGNGGRGQPQGLSLRGSPMTRGRRKWKKTWGETWWLRSSFSSYW